ncbi:Na+/H+ antiporter NhaC (plasmid) [Haloferax mediterranei ATCC 33500]|uniref:Arginine:ornithine antiporter n=1 Tax=Haloferax mediterranei (strain ATCC 33500 / DSM 1411 / JCM 8866 / NBRC 14739 / NCIMB 2177 / R-4) TaxID=523841 RepID=I3RAP1_HALMT|nr:Na+/H+ antiporter NhaC [Haloferax mediterranei]AFK21301.1 Na+/H+ antiporter [Haloferax mediterranei ATCC 33500]AHZ24603.1 arginine:ornithine antiporter [Haloferax mediterranei ATCC 33500]ELZ97367.1 Na+/H+ antiporter [Haloferax mediterranei ATCC 33500]MDX5990338.1 Na+/H+ antiporter NhaC [Haloferax mediterranei ATCC 33500]QCQ77000.1 Na+/H+ antiporter NhaC [Haloferax mediterranei ATCC 33500]
MVDFEPRLFGQLDPDERPSLIAALVPIAGMIVFLSVGIITFGLDPQFPLFWGIVFTGLFAHYHLGLSWEDLYDGISNGLLLGMKVILIMFTVYALISSWIQAGTIPSLMYYGLELFTPAVFLPIAAVLAAIIAFAVGSSWTTAGTLGVALIGIGSGLGIPAPMTAGAVLSGAYTGDKQSPLSDTTNLAAAVTNTDLYEHINAMRTGTFIAFALSVVLYAFLGMTASGNIPAGRVESIQAAIEGTYVVSPVVFLPLIITFGLAMYGVPALPTLGTGVIAGAVTSMLVQGTGFAAAWSAAQSGTAPETGMELVNGLLQSGGMTGGAWIVTIAIAALSLGGMLDRAGILAVLAHHLGRLCHNVASLTGATALSAVSMNILAAEQYVSIVVPGMTLRNLYDEQGLKTENLSRAIEASGTTTSALIPWSSGGLFMAGTLGVPTLEYAPYYFFGLLSPLVLIFMGMTGWQIMYKDQEQSSSTVSPSEGTATVAPGED